MLRRRTRGGLVVAAAVAGGLALAGPAAAGGAGPSASPAPTPASAASSSPSAPPSAAGATATALATPAAQPVGGPALGARGLVLDLPDGVPAPPRFSAAGWVLADLTTGDVVAARDPHGRYLPASTLKTLTLVATAPRLDPGTVVKALPQDYVEGSAVGISPGSTYTVHQLEQGAMLASGNDAATALARVAGGEGGQAATVAAMQATADRLGARDTVVRNPTGLDAPGQRSSAYDLALIGRAALADPTVRSLVATKHARFPGKEVRGKKRTGYQISNHNRMLFNYDGTVGVKNGYTVAARWTAITAVTRGGRTYLLAALKRGESTWRTQAALFDWAFRYGPQARPVGHLVTPQEVAAAAAPRATPHPAGPTGAAAAADHAVLDDTGRAPAWLAGVGLALAGTAAAVMALSARARRQQLHAARVARSVRRQPR